MTQREKNEEIVELGAYEEVEDQETDDAVLNYRGSRGSRKDKKGATGPVPAPVSGAQTAAPGGVAPAPVAVPAPPVAGAVPAAAVTAPAAVSFGGEQLHASVASVGDQDPWGAEDDEYSVPGAVTRNDERKRDGRAGAGMALRSSGTRGGKAPSQASAGMAPVTAPGATVGGVGGVGGVGAPQSMATTSMMQQAGGNENVGSQNSAMLALQGGQQVRATSQAFAPGAGSGSFASVGTVSAAGTSLSSEEAAALSAGGYGGGVEIPQPLVDGNGQIIRSSLNPDGSYGVNGYVLIDTDGDGIPDTPADQVYGGSSGGATAPRSAGVTGYVPGRTSDGSSGVTYGGTYGSGGTYGGSTGGTSGGTSGGVDGSVTGWSSGGTIYSGPTTAGGGTSGSGSGTSGSGVNFSQASASYAPTSGTDFSVDRSALRNESTQMEAISGATEPVKNLILSSPDPAKMFGVMTAPIAPYSQVVVTSAETVAETGDRTMVIASNLGDNARAYEAQEEASVDGAGRIN